MSFTNDNNLELQPAGGADWDSPLRANFSIIERGFHIKGTAGTDIVSGQICVTNSAGFTVPYDARSLGLNYPQYMSYSSVSSGANGYFVREGVVRSMSVWSGFIRPGEKVFVSPASPGFAVASYAGAGYPIGVAIDNDAIWISPGRFHFPELTTEVVTVANALIDATSPSANFEFSLANRGICRQLRVQANSANAWKISFWGGSARVNSELLYDTLTHSDALGSSVDITSRGYLDQAGFPWFNTDTASPALVFGRISIQSGSAVNTSHFAITVMVERFR